jgi:hypothetical protein
MRLFARLFGKKPATTGGNGIHVLTIAMRRPGAATRRRGGAEAGPAP